MRVFTWNEIIQSQNSSFFIEGSAITIGSFDGPHKGHEALFNEVLKAAKEKNYVPGLLTFRQALPGLKHPVNYLGDIATLSQRLREYEKRGFKFAIIVDFDETFIHIKGEDFFEILMNHINLKFLSEGQDFRCGFKGLFGINEITEFAFSRGLEVCFPKLVQFSSQRISSSFIRTMIHKAHFETVSELLERPYELEFPKELRKLGETFYPYEGAMIINRSAINQVIPEEGIYKVRTDSFEDAVLEIHEELLFLSGFEADEINRLYFKS